MAFIASIALTGVLISPVFLLAGWFAQPIPVRIRAQFNTLTRERDFLGA